MRGRTPFAVLGPALGAVALVVVVGLASAAGNPLATSPYERGDLGRLAPTPTLGPGGGLPPLVEDSDTPRWLAWLLDGFLVLLALAFVVMLVVLLIKMLSGPNPGLVRRRVLEPDELELLLSPLPDVDLLGRGGTVERAVDAGLTEIVSGDDVRAAIISAWVRLEEAAATAGTPRQPSDAPGDLVRRLLSGHDVRPDRLERLADLYRRARFSRDALTESDRAAAAQTFEDVAADLQGRSPGNPMATSNGPTRDASGRWPTRWS